MGENVPLPAYDQLLHQAWEDPNSGPFECVCGDEVGSPWADSGISHLGWPNGATYWLRVSAMAGLCRYRILRLAMDVYVLAKRAMASKRSVRASHESGNISNTF